MKEVKLLLSPHFEQKVPSYYKQLVAGIVVQVPNTLYLPSSQHKPLERYPLLQIVHYI